MKTRTALPPKPTSGFAFPEADTHYAPDRGLDPTHMEIRIQVLPSERSALGEVTTSYINRTRGTHSLKLNAIDFQDVKVTDEDGTPLKSRYDGNEISVFWDNALPIGATKTVRVSYRLNNPMTGMLFSDPDVSTFVATDNETERARYWLPCRDHPSFRATLDIHLTVPAGLTALANGKKVAEQDNGDGTQSVHWTLEQPCPPYLVCLAIGDFVSATGTAHVGGPDGKVPVATFTTTNFTSEDLARTFAPTTEMLDWITKRLNAPFPYPKYYQFAVPGIGGAMENISLVSWDDMLVCNEWFHQERGWLVDLINLHEMAHSYFGDSLVVREFAHVWLKESWATYMESVWLEETQDKTAMDLQMYAEKLAYMGEADDRYHRPIVTRQFDSAWDMYDHHLYPGGAWRIHMLRQIVGDEAFWIGIGDYVSMFSHGVVETSDFQRALERPSGMSLGRFFDQWLHNPGYPKLKATSKHDPKQGELVVTVEQTQAAGKEGVAIYNFDLEIALHDEKAGWSTHLLTVNASKNTAIVPVQSAPTQVVIDPNGRVLHKLDFDPGADLLLRSMTDCPFVLGRIHAIHTLAATGKRAHAEAITDAWKAEPEWQVRVEMARALAKSGTQASIDALAQGVAIEKDPRAMGHVLTECGHVRDPGIRAALRTWLDTSQPYPWARGAALKSLGAQRNADDLNRLTEEATVKSWASWCEKGALAGLGASHSKAATEFLLEFVGKGEGTRHARIAGMMALANAARWQEEGLREAATDALIDSTRAPEYNVRMGSARALGALGASRAAGVVEGLTQNLAIQDGPRVRRIAQKLRQKSNKGTSHTGLTKDLERISEKLRKAMDRIEVLESRLPKSEG